MNTIKSIFLTGLLIAALALPALAAQPTKPAMQDHSAMEEASSPPKAATEQQKRSDALYKEYEAKVMPIHDKLWGKFTELNALESVSGVTKDDISKLVDEIVALRAQIRTERNAFSAALEKEGLPPYLGHHSGGMEGGMMGCPGMMGGGMKGGMGGCGSKGGMKGHGMPGGPRGAAEQSATGHGAHGGGNATQPQTR